MTDTPRNSLLIDPGHDPVEKLVQHLRRQPYDLVRAHRLMHRLRVSAHEFQQALERLDQEVELPKGA